MKLRTITIVAAIGLTIGIIIHFGTFPYAALVEYPRYWISFLLPLIAELPLALFPFTLYKKQ